MNTKKKQEKNNKTIIADIKKMLEPLCNQHGLSSHVIINTRKFSGKCNSLIAKKNSL